jgi:hypothetical protein
MKAKIDKIIEIQQCKECGRLYPKGNGYHKELCGTCYMRKYRARLRNPLYKICKKLGIVFFGN